MEIIYTILGVLLLSGIIFPILYFKEYNQLEDTFKRCDKLKNLIANHIYMLDFLTYKEKVIIKQLTDKDRINDYHAAINTKAILDDSEKINKELHSLLLTLNGMDIPNENTDDRLTTLRSRMNYFSRNWDNIESWHQLVSFG